MPAAAAAPSKYRNKPTEIDGLTFASKREGRRYVELKNMQLAGQIQALRMQVPIRCVVNGEHVCDYVADFEYHNNLTSKVVVEDAKGALTDVYKLKRKLVKAILGIEIVEV